MMKSTHRNLQRLHTPALGFWRAELARGERTTTTVDALWRAACAEASALEALTPNSAAKDLRRARDIIEAARRAA